MARKQRNSKPVPTYRLCRLDAYFMFRQRGHTAVKADALAQRYIRRFARLPIRPPGQIS